MKSMSVIMTMVLLAGCDQSVPQPIQQDREQPLIEGTLQAVEYKRADGTIATLEYSEEPRPNGKYSRDCLIITHERRGPVKPVKQGESRVTYTFERTIKVIPARLIESITFIEKGTVITVTP